MDRSSINTLIVLFVLGILGVIGIGIIASQIIQNTDKTGVSDETITLLNTLPGSINTSNTYTVTNAPTGWKVNNCPIGSVIITNTSGGNTLTETTDYTLTASAGQIVFKNTSATVALIPKNATLIDYDYCGNGYINNSFGRNSLDLVSGIFALLILVAFVAGVYTIIKNWREE